jgi:Zn-dependent protease with chaperone function
MLRKLCLPLFLAGVFVAFLVGQHLVGTFVGATQMMSQGASETANHPTPDDYARLDRIMAELAVAAGKNPDWRPRSVVIKPSTVLNAYASPTEVGVTIGLMRAMDDDELRFIMAHELTHYLDQHAGVSIVPRLFSLFLMLGLIATAFLYSVHLLFDRRQVGTFAARLWLVIGLMGAVCYAESRLSLEHEWAADRGAVTLTGDPEAGARAFEAMIAHAKANPRKRSPMWGQAVMYTLFPSHPPMRERITALRAS